MNITLNSLTKMHNRIESLVVDEVLTLEECDELILFLKSIQQEIESNRDRYENDYEELINICLLSEYFLMVEISTILEKTQV